MEIKDKIHTIRGQQVIIDRDIALLYGVSTKRLNEQVRRNNKRFPDDFMFQLSEKEKNELVAKCDRLISLKHSTSLPYAFTEHGVASLSGVLKSKKAAEVHVQIMRAFIAMRRFLASNSDLFSRIYYLENKQIETDNKFEKIFRAIESKESIPKKNIFFNGQTFDAYKFASDIIRSAKESIILIDNYIDDTTLTILSKRSKYTQAIIYTANLTNTLKKRP